MSTASPAILSNFFEKQWAQNHPQYLSGLSRALFPTTFLEIAVYLQDLPTCPSPAPLGFRASLLDARSLLSWSLEQTISCEINHVS